MQYFAQIIVFYMMFCFLYSAEWNYDTIGPTSWPFLENIDFLKCRLNKQSPINIESKKVTCDTSKIKKIEFVNYERENGFDLSIKDYTVVSKFVRGTPFKMQVSGAGLPTQISPFELKETYFRWGSHVYE